MAALERYWAFLFRLNKQKLTRIIEVRRELEEAYGPLYSIVNQKEAMMPIDRNEETRIPITLDQKNELDRIITSRPHVFTNELLVFWRIHIANLKPILTEDKAERYGLPPKFKPMIAKQYRKRLGEYY